MFIILTKSLCNEWENDKRLGRNKYKYFQLYCYYIIILSASHW